MSSFDVYRVENSEAVADEFRRLADIARVAGYLRLFVRSAQWIMEELARTPHEFGKSRESHAADGLVARCGHAGPLTVSYAIREAEKTVFKRPCDLPRTAQ